MTAGRQSGKTVAVVQEVCEWAMSAPKRWPDEKFPQFWWTTASYKTKPKAWRDFNTYVPKEIVRQVHESESWIELRNGSRITFRSADGKEALVSERLHGLVCDEAGQYSPVIYDQLLAPMTATTNGPNILLGTPRGFNWFFQKYQQQVSGIPNWASFHWRTQDSPYVTPEWLAARKAETPERIWKQEYEAEFLTDGGEVFRNVDAAVSPMGKPDTYTVIGADCAMTNDWFVIWAVNSRGQWCHYERFQRVDWPIAKMRLLEAYRKLGAVRIELDTTGMNIAATALTQDLWAGGASVEAVNISGPLKRAMIDALMLRFEQGSFTIPADPYVIGEFKGFEVNRLPSGRERFSAPEGQHDDVVMAAGLALWGIRQFQSQPIEQPMTQLDELMERELEAAESGHRIDERIN